MRMSITRSETAPDRPRRFGPWRLCARAATVVLLTTALAACGGDDGTQPEPDDPRIDVMRVSEGLFDMRTAPIFNNCGWPDEYPGEYWVSISADTFSMGNWVGNWDSLDARARAESNHIIDTYRECTINQWSTVSLRFTSPDSFVGSVSYYRRLSGECLGPTPCTATWNIFGKRVSDP
jgi:hypothetical protein